MTNEVPEELRLINVLAEKQVLVTSNPEAEFDFWICRCQ